MNSEEIVQSWEVLNNGAPEAAIRSAASALGISLPQDYMDFLRKHNGGEGFIGKHYLMLWKAEELKRFNDEYQVNDYAPGLLFFGSDGGGDGYAFDTRSSSMPIVSVPFIGMELRYADRVADSFTDLLDQLAK